MFWRNPAQQNVYMPQTQSSFRDTARLRFDKHWQNVVANT